MIACCAPFQTAMLDAGKKGIAVLCKNEQGIRCFCLQARACDADEEDRMKNMPDNRAIPKLRIVTQATIQFCPFCGTRLDDLIGRGEREFDERAEEQRRLLL